MAKLVYAFLLALLIPAQTVWAKSIQDAMVETSGTGLMYTIDKGNILAYRENGSTLVDEPVIIGDRATTYKGSASRINVENSVETGINEGSNKGPTTFHAFQENGGSLDDCKFALESSDPIEYNGQAHEPSFTLKDRDGNLLIKGTDYDVSYDENVKASANAKIIITGKGKYSGEVTFPFTIKPKLLSMEGVTVKDKYHGDEQVGEIVNRGELIGICEVDKGKVDVDWSEANIWFTTTQSVGKAPIELSGLKLTGPAKDNYELYVSLDGNVLDLKDITGFDFQWKSSDPIVYNGKEHTLSFTLKDRNGKELAENTDYGVSYDKNKNASDKAEIIVTGKGEYTGKATFYFTIHRKQLTLVNATVKDKRQHDDEVGEIADKGYLDGVEDGDKVDIDWSEAIIEFSSTAVIGNNIPVTLSGLTLAGAAKDNYDLPQPIKLEGKVLAQPEPTPPPPPPAEETWYILTIEGFDGLVTSPAADSYSVVEGSSFTVHFNLPEGYVESDLRVMLDESEIEFRHVNGNLYAVTIGNVISDACLSIDKQAVFTIKIPDVSGVVTDPSAGIYPVGRFDSFPFSLTLEDDYDQSEVSVRINGEELSPLALRSAAYDYRIDSISKDLHIEILNVSRNDAVANETIDSDRPHIYTYPGTLCVELFREAPVTIHALSGLPVVARRLSPGIHRFSLPAGVYIVTVGKEGWKVRMSGSN